MKSTDYLIIQAPMITELHLKGNALLLFALITGFTRDDATRFRGSLTYMAEWLNTSRTAVIRALDELEASGLIKKYTVLVGKLKVNEYSSNYNSLVGSIDEHLQAPQPAEVIAEVVGQGHSRPGIGMTPVSECNQYQNDTNALQKGTESGTEMTLVSESDQYQNETKVVSKWDKSSTRMVPNNIDNIIYSCSYCQLSEQEQKQEQEGIFECFFWRNAVDPQGEVDRFIGHNSANGWTNTKGREYDTAEKRRGLAALWKFQQEGRVSSSFLAFWQQLCNCAKNHFLIGSRVLLDETAKMTESAELVQLTCKRKTMEYIERNLDNFGPIFSGLLQGRKLQYCISR